MTITETLERIELGQARIRIYLTKAREQVDNVNRLLNQLDAITDEPVKNATTKIVVDDSMQPEPTIIPRVIPWRKRDFKQLNRTVVH
jgi:chromosome condensin MukBEF ATPase and DNA-binding subunit MukB